MRIIRFSSEKQSPRPGLLLPKREVVIDLPNVGADLDIGVPETTRAILDMARWRDRLELLKAHAVDAGTGLLPLADVSLAAPIVEPNKIVCVGLNYEEHIEESDEERPEEPVLFSKYPTSIVGPGDAIRWDPSLTEQVDFEVELTTVIGKRARRVKQDVAREHVAGYTVANDVSARDLQFADEQWVRGKSLDTFCPLGPSIVTEDELGDPEDLDIWSDLNGKRMQESTTGSLLFGLDELISVCSDAFTLLPGDVILTGTPTGVGFFRDPPELLNGGDDIQVGVEGIGTMSNPCRPD